MQPQHNCHDFEAFACVLFQTHGRNWFCCQASVKRWRASYINCAMGFCVCPWVITAWCERGVISCKAYLQQVCNLGSLPSVWVERAKPISPAYTYILIRVCLCHMIKIIDERQIKENLKWKALCDFCPVNEQLLWLY